VRLLLDTHIVLWVLRDSRRVSRRARELIDDPENQCWVSCASFWEIAIKATRRGIDLGLPLAQLERAVSETGFRTLDISPRHAVAIERVVMQHGDPFDRLLLAQCEVETLRLLTSDAQLATQPVAIAI
jgi:PIN domain nuclease of toxin-antitoxin system